MPRYGLSPLGRGLFSLVLPCIILGSMSGQQVVLGIGIGVGLLMIIGYVWSAAVLKSVEIEASASSDVTLGETLEIWVAVSGAEGLECAVEVMNGETLGLRIPASGSVLAVARQMGRFDAVPVVVQTGVPDGVVGAVERRQVSLAQPIYVYPAVVPVTVPVAPHNGATVSSEAGEMTGLREYTPGDKLRDVHWPALARSGTVLVRDHRSPTTHGRVTVALGHVHADKTEKLAGMARSAIHVLIQRGHQVNLLIGAELIAVSSEVEAWRRLACITADQDPMLELARSGGPILTLDPTRGATWATQV